MKRIVTATILCLLVHGFGIVVFTLGSLACALAQTLDTLVAARVLQGVGGSMLLLVGRLAVLRSVPRQDFLAAMPFVAVPGLMGPLIGPSLGGWLVQVASWHWIFLINLPIGIVALIVAVVVLPKDAPKASEAFDFKGMLLLSPGLALFLFGVSSLPETGTVASARVLVSGLAGLALIAAFVVHALRTDHPLIDLTLFRNRQLTFAVLTMSVFAIGFFGAGLLFPSYFLQVRGESTLAAGLLLAPQGIGAMLTMPIAGQLVDRIGPGKIVLTGLALIAAGMSVFTQVGVDTGYPLLLGALFVMGMGMGCTMMPTMTAALQTLTDNSIARGSTLMNIVQQAAGSIGTAAMSVILTSRVIAPQGAPEGSSGQPDAEMLAQLPPEMQQSVLSSLAEAFAFTFLIATIIMIFALIPAAFLPRKRAEKTEGAAAPVVMH